MKSRNRVFIISGPSGVGKTTITEKVLKEVPNIKRTISYTTREKRKGEINGRDYRFISRGEFKRLIKKKAFLEWAQVLDNFYGTLKREVIAIVKKGCDVLLCIDVQGAEQVQKKLPGVVSIFIIPPSIEVLKERLLKRGESAKNIQKRISLARKELKMLPYYDYGVENNVLSKAIALVKYIIYAERARIRKRR